MNNSIVSMDKVNQFSIIHKDDQSTFYLVETNHDFCESCFLKDSHLFSENYISTFEIISDNYILKEKNKELKIRFYRCESNNDDLNAIIFERKYEYKAVIHNYEDFSIIIYKTIIEINDSFFERLFIIVLGNQNQTNNHEYFQKSNIQNFCDYNNYFFKDNKIFEYCFGYYNYIFNKQIAFSFPNNFFKYDYDYEKGYDKIYYNWIDSKNLSIRDLMKLSITIIKLYSAKWMLLNTLNYCKNNNSLIYPIIYKISLNYNKIINYNELLYFIFYYIIAEREISGIKKYLKIMKKTLIIESEMNNNFDMKRISKYSVNPQNIKHYDLLLQQNFKVSNNRFTVFNYNFKSKILYDIRSNHCEHIEALMHVYRRTIKNIEEFIYYLDHNFLRTHKNYDVYLTIEDYHFENNITTDICDDYMNQNDNTLQSIIQITDKYQDLFEGNKELKKIELIKILIKKAHQEILGIINRILQYY